MKIIFLDIDGVLNSKRWNDSHAQDINNGKFIDESKILLLKELVSLSKAKIVMHSGWRFWFNDKMEPMRRESKILADLLHDYGINLYDKTPDFSTAEIRKSKQFSLVKAQEILAWLKENKKITGYVVIDDLDLHHKDLYKYQVRPNPDVGLTEQEVKRAAKILDKYNE